jgi:Skp family chaperone for outer membrane proteins
MLMISRRMLCAFALAAVSMILPSRFAVADDAPPRIGTVNTAKIFSEMAETKDLMQKMKADGEAIEAEKNRREADIKETEKKRNLFNDGSDDFNKANKELIEKALQLRVWGELVNADLIRQQKTQMRNLFNKIEEATSDVAKQKNLDIVLVDSKLELPKEGLEKIQLDQLRMMINQRVVIFNNGRLDITNEVLAAVDAKYKKK